MLLDRNNLIDSIFNFINDGDCLITGVAGIGKTYILKQIANRLREKGIPCLFLKTERLGDWSREAIFKVLNVDDLIEKLKEETKNLETKRAVLIIDGFDAARDPEVQERILIFLERAKKELGNSWRIAVSVRTYDAQFSRRLNALFPGLDGLAITRTYEIGLLNDEEVLKSLEPIQFGLDLFKSASDEFKAILQIPINLWLLEKVLEGHSFAPDLTNLKSQIGLLDEYWKILIEKNQLDQTDLKKIAITCNEMVEAKTLRLEVEIGERILGNKLINKLVSSGFFADEKSDKTGIEFYHNILFDYAISLHVLPLNYNNLIKFLEIDPLRVILLRPSLTFYFSRLWYSNRSSFWENVWESLGKQDSTITLFFRTIIPGVIVSECVSSVQLEPVILQKQISESHYNEIVLRLCEAHEMLAIKRDEIWAHFLEEVSNQLNSHFLNQLTSVLHGIVERHFKRNLGEISFGRIGIVARNVFEWCMRGDSRTSNLETFNASRIVPLLLKTYPSNPSKTLAALEKILRLIYQKDFNINFLRSLSGYLEYIFEYFSANEFVKRTYYEIFCHNEESRAPTSLSNSAVLQLISNRRQDFDLCQYSLAKKFSFLIEKNALLAGEIALNLGNQYSFEHQFRSSEHQTKQVQKFYFEFRGLNVSITPDLSYVWAHGKTQNWLLELIDVYFEYLRGALTTNHSIANKLLDQFAQLAQVGFLWGQLIVQFSLIPQRVIPFAEDLLVAIPLILLTDTSHQVGELYKLLKSDSVRIKKIEKVLFQLPEFSKDYNFTKKNILEKRDRLLAQLPKALLSKRSQNLLSRSRLSDHQLKNTPPFSMDFISSKVEMEEILALQGVDVKKEANQKLLSISKSIDELKSLIESCSGEENQNLLANLVSFKESIISTMEADRSVVTNAWTSIAEAINSILKSKSEKSVAELHQMILLLTDCAAYPYPKESRLSDGESLSWSPSPRSVAAEAIARLLAIYPNADLKSVFKNLLDDKLVEVAYIATSYLPLLYKESQDFFFECIQSQVRKEFRQHVCAAIIRILFFALKDKETDKIKMLVQQLEQTLSELPQGSSVFKQLSSLYTRLYLERNDSDANIWLKKFSQDLPINSLALRQTAGDISEYLSLEILSLPKGEDIINVACSRIVEILKKTVAALQEWDKKKELNPELYTTEALKNLLSIPEYLLIRIQVAIEILQPSHERRIPMALREELRPKMVRLIWPLLNEVSNQPSVRYSYLMGQTVHLYVNILCEIVSFDPSSVIDLALKAINLSEGFGYRYDSMSVNGIIKLVQIVLADHKAALMNKKSMIQIVELLNLFSDAGWNEARQLSWELERLWRG